MAFSPPFESIPASSQSQPERPAANPRDVAELFDWLNVEHLRYREFPPAEGMAAADVPLGRAFPRRIYMPPVRKKILMMPHPRAR